MSDEITEDKRLGVIVPRSVLLPPYLINNQYFTEYADAIDSVLGTNVDAKVRVLKNLRNMWVSNPAAEQKILNADMLQLGDWSQPEREILVKQVNMLGMKLKSAGVLTNDNYQIVSRFLGQYWFGKGTQAFIEFINFCLDTNLLIHRMWAQDLGDFQYHNLTVENEDGTPPGTPKWQGGNWFPTTHIQVEAQSGFPSASLNTLAEFLYEIANYNLVLNSVNSTFDLYIVENLQSTSQSAKIVSVGLYYDPTIVVSSVGRYGTDAPPSYILNAIPTQVYAESPASLNIMSDPTGWFSDSNGHKLPVYAPSLEAPSTGTSIPTVMVGNASSNNVSSMILLANPDGWLPIPGSVTNEAFIPYWNSIPTIQNSNSISTSSIGGRNYFLVNPTNWNQMEVGKYVPYW